MQISNEIVLRPRFSQPLDINQNKVLELFENAKNSQDAIKINILDSHVFLKIPIIYFTIYSTSLFKKIESLRIIISKTLQLVLARTPIFIHFDIQF